MMFLVLAKEMEGRWETVGQFDAKTPQGAVREAALQHEASNAFLVFDLAAGKEFQISYRKRVVGIQGEPDEG